MSAPLPYGLSVSPGQILGYLKDGRPVRAIAGGSEPQATPPAATPTPPATPAPPAATPTPSAPADPPKPEPKTDLSTLPADVRKIIEDARAEAAKHRTDKQTATQTAQAAQAQRDAVLKALGIKADGTDDIDPVKATEDAQNQAWVAQVQLAVFRAAGSLEADASKLLDSVSFIDSLDEAIDVEPSDPKFAGQIKDAIKKAVEKNPTFKSNAPAVVPTKSGAPLAPGAPGEGAKRPSSLGAAVSAALTPTST